LHHQLKDPYHIGHTKAVALDVQSQLRKESLMLSSRATDLSVRYSYCSILTGPQRREDQVQRGTKRRREIKRIYHLERTRLFRPLHCTVGLRATMAVLVIRCWVVCSSAGLNKRASIG
jgi:hypothetical protein